MEVPVGDLGQRQRRVSGLHLRLSVRPSCLRSDASCCRVSGRAAHQPPHALRSFAAHDAGSGSLLVESKQTSGCNICSSRKLAVNKCMWFSSPTASDSVTDVIIRVFDTIISVNSVSHAVAYFAF